MTDYVTWRKITSSYKQINRSYHGKAGDLHPCTTPVGLSVETAEVTENRSTTATSVFEIEKSHSFDVLLRIYLRSDLLGK